MSQGAQVETLRREIAACRICAEKLDQEPRPVAQFSESSQIVIIGQAPGSKVHASGVPWDDASGERLRDWLQLERDRFYDESQFPAHLKHRRIDREHCSEQLGQPFRSRIGDQVLH